jgi:hypothetical protein
MSLTRVVPSRHPSSWTVASRSQPTLSLLLAAVVPPGSQAPARRSPTFAPSPSMPWTTLRAPHFRQLFSASVTIVIRYWLQPTVTWVGAQGMPWLFYQQVRANILAGNAAALGQGTEKEVGMHVAREPTNCWIQKTHPFSSAASHSPFLRNGAAVRCHLLHLLHVTPDLIGPCSRRRRSSLRPGSIEGACVHVG